MLDEAWIKLFGLPVLEYYNQAGATVFEVHGTIKELQPAITNMLDFNEITVIRIITSEEPIVSKSHKRDKNTFYKEGLSWQNLTQTN